VSNNSGGDFDLANDEREVSDIERRSAEPTYWDDPNIAQQEMRRLGELKSRLDTWSALETTNSDLQGLVELAGGDPEMIAEIELEHERLKAQLDTLELESALNGPHDRSNALLVIHSGEGFDADPDVPPMGRAARIQDRPARFVRWRRGRNQERDR
jgi:peptide chain release factor 2